MILFFLWYKSQWYNEWQQIAKNDDILTCEDDILMLTCEDFMFDNISLHLDL